MRVAVYGASGHTARFVILELLARGHTPIGVARTARDAVSRVAALDDPPALDRALRGTQAVINCAGPFLDTAVPVIEAALRARIHYLDITAEQASARATLAAFDECARANGVCVIPAAGFYGGLGDLLASAAMAGWDRADRIDLAIALDSWQPTLGTRRTGARNTAPRVAIRAHRLQPVIAHPPRVHDFGGTFGEQPVIDVALTEMILIARHLRVGDVRNAINAAPLDELSEPTTPAPTAADSRGRSTQQFQIDLTACIGKDQRRITVRGRDIYAVTAPIVVESLERIVADPRRPAGAYALGELVDAHDVLAALAGRGELLMAT